MNQFVPTTDRVTGHVFVCSALLALLISCHKAVGFTQHLVSAGETWSDIDRKIRPGDEIILLPGEHRPGLLDHLHGESDKPITIRGIDPERPPIIKADRYGIRLRNATHVNIHNIVIEGASVAGLHVTSESAPRREPIVDTCQSIVIRDVQIRRTGFEGLRHGLWVIDLEDVTIENVTVEGWSGAGIEVHGCRRVELLNCRLIGREAFPERYGVRVRGGTNQVWLRECFFENAGDIAMAIGWRTAIDDFYPPLEPVSTGRILDKDKRFEVDRVQVRNCIVRGSACAAAFKHVQTVQFRSNTIYRPTLTVLAFDAPHDDPRLADNKKVVLSSNLIVWQPGDIKHLAMFGARAKPDGVRLERNLWWSKQLTEQLKKLGPMPGRNPAAQITDLDPQLNDDLVPTNNAATLYGAGPR